MKRSILATVLYAYAAGAALLDLVLIMTITPVTSEASFVFTAIVMFLAGSATMSLATVLLLTSVTNHD